MACEEAGITIARGHSIRTQEPIFGLSVSGIIIHPNHIKKNTGAESGDLLLLTKPIGVGIASLAMSKFSSNDLPHGDDILLFEGALQAMTTVNTVGQKLAGISEVHAITDVTGFGVAGHLFEMCEASGLSCELDLHKVNILPRVYELARQNKVPGGVARNIASLPDGVLDIQDKAWERILNDPQTSGGLLLSVAPSKLDKVVSILEPVLQTLGMSPQVCGRMVSTESTDIRILAK